MVLIHSIERRRLDFTWNAIIKGKLTFLGKLYKYKIFTVKKKKNHNIGPLLFANIQHWCSEHCRANRKESRWAVLVCPSFLISFVVGWFSDKSRIGQWLACRAVILCCSQWRGQWCIYNEATKVRLTQWGLTGGVLNWWFESQMFSPNAIWGLTGVFVIMVLSVLNVDWPDKTRATL